jgi:hypothetical protein
MAENRTVTAIYITEPFLVALDRSRGNRPRSAFLAKLVEADVDKPGVYDEPTKQVPRSKAAKRLTLSLRGEVVDKASHRRGDRSLAAYAASVILTALDKLERTLAYEDYRRHQEEEAERQRAVEAARQPKATQVAPATPARTKRTERPAPRKKARIKKPKPRSQHQQPRPVGGHSRVDHRPRPPREIVLEDSPRATWRGSLPPHLQEVEDKLQAEQAQRRAQPPEKQRPPECTHPRKPASSTSAASAVEKLAPPPSPSPAPPPSPSTHRGSQEPYTRPREPFAAQEPTMNQIPPRRPTQALGPRVVEKPQEELDHADLLALLQRHEAGLERFPAVVPVAALDGEGGRLVHLAMTSGLKGPGDALRVIVGADNETMEIIPLVGPGVLDASWARLTTLLETLASRLGGVVEVTPYLSAIALEDTDEEEVSIWDQDEDDDEDEHGEDAEAPDVPCGHVLLAYIQVATKAGGPSAFPGSSMW